MFEEISYEKLKNKLTPLDLLLFKGTDCVSDTIRFCEEEELKDGLFSHCGLVVNSEILPNVKQLVKGKWYVWESTLSATHGILRDFTDGVPSITGQGKFGVQIRDLEAVVNAYLKTPNTKIAWCKLITNPWNKKDKEGYFAYYNRKKKLIETVTDTHLIYGNRTYDCNVFDLLGALFPIFRIPRDIFDELLVCDEKILTSIDINIDPTGWLFCSELVTIVYQRIKLIDLTVNPHNIVPVDFILINDSPVPKLVEMPIYVNP